MDEDTKEVVAKSTEMEMRPGARWSMSPKRTMKAKVKTRGNTTPQLIEPGFRRYSLNSLYIIAGIFKAGTPRRRRVSPPPLMLVL